MTMAPPSRISSRPPPPSRVALAMPTEAQKNIAPIIVISAVEGWGKTSALAHAPDAAVLMAPGETGYLTLYGAGRVPAVPSASITTWTDLLATIDGFIADGAPKTLGLDALGGFERLCHDHICRTEFNGDWGEKGFSSYMRGYEVSVSEWVKLLAKLERLRNTHGTTIVLLSHVKIKTFKNPQGSDFDRYTSDVHDKTWAATAKLADAVLFGNFFIYFCFFTFFNYIDIFIFLKFF